MHPIFQDNGITTIEGRTLAAVYDKAIRTVWTKGKILKDQRGNRTREIRNLVTCITTGSVDYPGIGPTTQRYGDDFADGLINDSMARKKGSEFDYSYGERMRRDSALYNVITILQHAPESRTAVLPIFMPSDTQSAMIRSTWTHAFANVNNPAPEVPCMTQVMFLVRDGALHATLIMRSNDMVGAYPSDVYGVRKLQEYVAKQIGAKVGTITHFAQSAHIIEENDGAFMEAHMKTPKRF